MNQKNNQKIIMITKVLKNILALLVFFFAIGEINAQQQLLQSQYMFNGLVINPAYAGSHEAISVTGTFRSQWAGFEGAPTSQALSGHMPIARKRIALGATLFRETMGPQSQTGINLAYAYRIPLRDGVLSMGLQAGAMNMRDNGNYNLFNPNDPNFSNTSISAFMPSFGAGLYYSSSNLVLGFSIPNLAVFNQGVGENAVASIEEIRHYIFNTGYILDLNSDLKFKPGMLLRYKEGQGLEVDLNASLIINQTFWFGASYRHENSLNFMTQLQITSQLQFGYAYDLITNNNLSNASNGSHEIMLNYRFRLGGSGDLPVTPNLF